MNEVPLQQVDCGRDRTVDYTSLCKSQPATLKLTLRPFLVKISTAPATACCSCQTTHKSPYVAKVAAICVSDLRLRAPSVDRYWSLTHGGLHVSSLQKSKCHDEVKLQALFGYQSGHVTLRFWAQWEIRSSRDGVGVGGRGRQPAGATGAPRS